jgi:hypothetical protein
MVDKMDKEIDAIRTVLNALEPLGQEARNSVIEYVTKRLQIQISTTPGGDITVAAQVLPGAATPFLTPPGHGVAVTHIKDLKLQKKPRSANEMAALVAYFLAELAPTKDQKKTINTKDVETFFKIAEFPLPGHVRMTLPSAKAAGYFDAVGDGDYRLNAVGHNLVVHSMPRGAAAEAPPKRARTKKRSSGKAKKR